MNDTSAPDWLYSEGSSNLSIVYVHSMYVYAEEVGIKHVYLSVIVRNK